MAKEATKPQTNHADRMILPSKSQKYLWYAGVEKQTNEKV